MRDYLKIIPALIEYASTVLAVHKKIYEVFLAAAGELYGIKLNSSSEQKARRSCCDTVIFQFSRALSASRKRPDNRALAAPSSLEDPRPSEKREIERKK